MPLLSHPCRVFLPTLLIAAALPLAAQQTGFTWGPEFAPIGCPFYYSFANSGPATVMYSPCSFAVFNDLGDLVFLPACPADVVLASGEFYAHRWNQVDLTGHQVAAGVYHLNAPDGPAVTVGGTDACVAPIGARSFELCAPLDPGAPYVLAAAFTNTTGIRSCAGTIPLDADALLIRSLRSPAFQGFTGVLDSSGKASAHIVLPNDGRAFQILLAFVVLDPTAPCKIRRISAATRTTIF